MEQFEEVIPLFHLSPQVPSCPDSPVSPLVLLSSESPVSPLVPSSSATHVIPPSLPLPLPLTASSSALPPLVPFNPSSSPAQNCEDLHWFYRPPVPPSPKNPGSISSLSTHHSSAACKPIICALSPPFLAPSETIILTTPLGSLVPPAPLWSDVVLPTPSAPSVFVFPPASPPSSVPLASPQSPGFHAPPWMLVATVPTRPPAPAVLHGLFGLSAPPWSPSPVESPLVVPRVLSAKSPPWVLPPSTLP